MELWAKNRYKYHNHCINSCGIKFIYSEKATKFCEIFTLPLSYVVPVKSKVKISQNYVAFSEYMNFKNLHYLLFDIRAVRGRGSGADYANHINTWHPPNKYLDPTTTL